MPKVLPEYLEQRRQQILDGAAACFARRGFHQTTMQDICAEAELSPGAVYRYFRSKDEIIQAMCARGQAEDANTIRSITEAGSTLDAFDEMVQVFLLGIEDRESCALTLELTAESLRNPLILESIRASREAIRTPIIEYVLRAQAHGDFDPTLDAGAVARVMISLYLGMVTQKMAEPELDVEAYSDAVRALFHGTFRRQSADAERPVSALQH